MVLNHLHSIGVRTLEDLPRVVPPTGARVRMGHLGFQAAPLASVHPDDARSLEALFAAYGSPSAGVDVIVRAEGTPMADGGGVLELNLPCGAAYLGDAAAEVADRELLALVGHDAEFVASGGRVPVWLAHAAAGNGAARIEAAFRARFPEGLVGALAPSGWLPLLTDRRATAILAWVTDEAFEQHGIPERLRPIFVQDREASDVAAGVTGASVDTAGGTFAAIDDL